MLVACPECKEDIEVAFAKIINDDLALEESIVCPCCNKLINHVHRSNKMSKKEYVNKGAVKDINGEIQRMLDKLK
jgi:uncharacterized protein YbaR (Trm112 family)